MFRHPFMTLSLFALALPGISVAQPMGAPGTVAIDADVGALVELQMPAPTGATLAEFERLALSNNPGVAQAAARVRSLCGNWVQVGLPPNPTIGYTASEIGANDTAGQQGGFVGQRFVTGGKLQLNRAVAAQEVEQARQELAALQQRVLTDVRTAYYDALIAQRQVDLTGEIVALSDRAVESSRSLVEAQEASRVGLLQTQVQAQDARISQRRAQNELAAAWRRLTSALGMPDLSIVPLAGSLDEEAPLDWDESLHQILNGSPEISAAVASIERARWALRRACAEVKPDVNAQVTVQKDISADEVITGVQLGVALPIINRNQGGIRRAQADITVAERNLDRLRLDLRERLATEFRQYADARFAERQYSTVILPKARETFELVTIGYQQGEIGYLDMLAAQRTFAQTNLAYLQSLRDLWRSSWRIRGQMLSGSLRR